MGALCQLAGEYEPQHTGVCVGQMIVIKLYAWHMNDTNIFDVWQFRSGHTWHRYLRIEDFVCEGLRRPERLWWELLCYGVFSYAKEWAHIMRWSKLIYDGARSYYFCYGYGEIKPTHDGVVPTHQSRCYHLIMNFWLPWNLLINTHLLINDYIIWPSILSCEYKKGIIRLVINIL